MSLALLRNERHDVLRFFFSFLRTGSGGVVLRIRLLRSLFLRAGSGGVAAVVGGGTGTS